MLDDHRDTPLWLVICWVTVYAAAIGVFSAAAFMNYGDKNPVTDGVHCEGTK
jgi:hypothetical protein